MEYDTKKFREAVEILQSHHLRDGNNTFDIYKEFPHLLEVAKPNISQNWSSEDPTGWLIKDFRIFMVYICKQGLIAQTSEFLPTRSVLSQDRYIEWQGGIRYSLHFEKNEITFVGIHYGPTTHVKKYERIFNVDSKESYSIIASEIVNVFYNLSVENKCIFFPCLQFTKKNFPIFERMILNALEILSSKTNYNDI